MDRELIAEKLESLRRCVRRIAEKCPNELATLIAEPDLQDILTLNLSRAVQLSVDVGAHLIADLDVAPPDTMGQTFEVLSTAGIVDADLAANLKKAVGFRNVATHNYEAIDWTIVHAIARNRLDDFHAFAAAVASKLDEAEA